MYESPSGNDPANAPGNELEAGGAALLLLRQPGREPEGIRRIASLASNLAWGTIAFATAHLLCLLFEPRPLHPGTPDRDAGHPDLEEASPVGTIVTPAVRPVHIPLNARKPSPSSLQY
ncbi:hypothetical protein [Acidipila sp. EB88]|uniref:hypothetical protein n=1 Tax=Acidipila sp. EB88 TaxID=2305226 RepID=UPI000F5F2FF8|nr:hypothetical protein [Acidipila sp. EB88]